jgi:hypothetical protein
MNMIHFKRMLAVDVDEIGLWAKFHGNGRIYFDEHRTYRPSPAQDVIRFDRTSGDIQGLTMNPGSWEIKVLCKLSN